MLEFCKVVEPLVANFQTEDLLAFLGILGNFNESNFTESFLESIYKWFSVPNSEL